MAPRTMAPRMVSAIVARQIMCKSQSVMEFILVALATAACSSSSAKNVGTQGGPCTAGGGCDPGLVCLSSLCENPGASTGSPTSTTTGVGTDTGTGTTVALGMNNPAQGDCATNTSEAATSVGSVVLSFTPSSFQAEIQLQSGYPNVSYGVFMQQVPGSCPQPSANAGTLTTDSTGRGHASTAVSLVPGATTFYVQLVPGGVGAPSYTSDRISTVPGG